MGSRKKGTTAVPHPLRQANGKMPHEEERDEYVEWLILNGMTEADYQASVKLGDEYIEEVKRSGAPLRTDQLTDDQRGWAALNYPQHFERMTARWRTIKGKSSKVEPWKLAFNVRSRSYNHECKCNTPVYEEWGRRWDGAVLEQCQECGEVIVRNGKNHDKEELEETAA